MLEPSNHRLIQKVIRRIIPFCIICFLLNYIDRTNIVIAQPSMQSSMKNFTPDVFLIGTSLFYITYCLFELPSNLIQQRVGPRRWIARIMITWGLVSTCFIFTAGPKSFYTLRALLGLAEAGFFPGILLYLSYWVPREYRARASAWFFLSQAVALAIGNSLGGLILSGASNLPGEPWQWLFVLEGLPSIIMGIVVLLYLTDKPADATWLTADERNRLIAIMADDRKIVSTTTAHGRQDFMHALASPYTWFLSLIYSGMIWAYFPVNSYTSIFFRNILASAKFIVLKPASQAATTQAAGIVAGAEAYTPEYMVSLYVGLVSAIPFVAAALTMLGIARHSDRHNERKFHLAATCGLMALGLSCAGLAKMVDSGGLSTALAVIGISLAAVGWFGAFATFWALPAQLLTGTAVAAALAIINSIGNIVGNFGCPQIKVLLKLNDTQFLFLAAAFAALACAVTLLVRLPKPPQAHVSEFRSGIPARYTR